MFIGRTDADAGEELIHLKEILMLGKIEGNRSMGRGQDGWIAPLTQWM